MSVCLLFIGGTVFKNEYFSTLVWKTLNSMVSEQRLLAFNILPSIVKDGCKIAQ